MLLRRWERARQGDGQLVQIVGELVGKSRLIEEFHVRLRENSRHTAAVGAAPSRRKTRRSSGHRMGPRRFGGAT